MYICVSPRNSLNMRLFFSIGLIFLSQIIQAQIKFVVTHIPLTTPSKDTLFITGSFNNWVANDPAYSLKLRPDGKFEVKVENEAGKFEYKFTRGSWTKVETDSKNSMIANRIWRGSRKVTIYLGIDNWLDLGGARPFDYNTFIFFTLALVGLLVIFRFKNKIHNKHKLLMFFMYNAIFILAEFGMVFYIQLDIIYRNMLILGAFFLLYFWVPLRYLFTKSLYNNSFKITDLSLFIPSLFIVLWIFVRILNLNFISSWSKPFNYFLSFDEFYILLFSLLFNSIIFIILFFKFFSLANTKLLYFSFIEIFIFLLFNILILSSLFLHLGNIRFYFEILFVLFSLPLFYQFYLFRDEKKIIDKSTEKTKEEKFRKVKLWNEAELEVINKLQLLMEKECVYIDSNLNVRKLATMLNEKPYLVSKIINEYFGKSFRDFINEYRILKFIEYVNSGKFKDYTFLAICYEVGFNSKSTFNLAFKKFTGQSPSYFFKKK